MKRRVTRARGPLSRISTALVALGFAGFAAAACHTNSPDGRAEQACVDDCTARARARCSERECIRGCKFSLDRLLEHEGRNVVGCVAGGKGACDDVAWADCAARIGVHADGGPPAPPAPGDDDDQGG